jgi:hypothetical protein
MNKLQKKLVGLQVQIDHCSANVAMSQQFFDRAQMGAGIQKVSGEGMTKGVNRVVFVAKVCGIHFQVEAVLKASAVHWLALCLPFKQISDRTMLPKVCPQSVKRS